MRPRELVPWRDFTIETSWSPEVAAIELRKRIGARRFFARAGTTGDEPFAGEAKDGTTFQFSRIIRYRNSFLPAITATVQPSSPDGACIHVTMRLHVFVMVFGVVWMSGATLGALTTIAHDLGQGDIRGFVALGFPLFGAALFTLPFAFEARIAERLLREVYAAAPRRAATAYR